MTERELEELKKKAMMQEERAKAELVLARNDPYEARMRAAHENRMEAHHAFVQSSPNSYAPSERAAAEAYFAEKRAEKQREEARDEAVSDRYSKEKIEEYRMIGRRDQGMMAEAERTAATKYASDNTLKGIEVKAKSDAEIARNKAAAEAELREREREWETKRGETEWNARKEIENIRANAQTQKSAEDAETKERIAREKREFEEKKHKDKMELGNLKVLMEKGIIKDGDERISMGKKVRYDAKLRRWVEVKD